MANQNSSININPEVNHHKGGTQSINNLMTILLKGKYFSCKIILDDTYYGSGFFAKIMSPFEYSNIKEFLKIDFEYVKIIIMII